MTAIFLTAALAGSDVWPGFHGAERQGVAPATTVSPPTRWSPDQNVAWRTPIPGRGLSSPVVADGRVYLTTAYDSPRYASLRRVLDIASLVLLCAVAAVGIGSVVRLAGLGGRGGFLRLCAAAALAFLIFMAAGTILFAEPVLGLTDSAMRSWFVTLGLLGTCVLLGALANPPRSRAWLVLGIVAIALAAPVYLALPEKHWIFRLSGLRSIAIHIGLASLPGLGILLLLARKMGDVEGAPSALPRLLVRLAIALDAATIGAGLIFVTVAAIAAGGLSGISIPRPAVGWAGAAIALAIAAASLVFHLSRAARIRTHPDPRAAAILIASALALGAVPFASLNFLLRDRAIIRSIVCIDGDTGAILWSVEGLEAKGGSLHPANSHATPTPALDGGRLYAYFGAAGMIAVDAQSKDILWTNQELPFESPFGAAASPVVWDGFIFVVSDSEPSRGARPSEPSYIVAIDRATGRIAWRRERPTVEDTHATFATPIVRRIGERDAVIAQGWEDVRGYEARSGEELWIQPLRHGGAHLVAGIAADERRLYVATARGMTALDIAKLGQGEAAVAWTQRVREVRGEKSATPVVVEGLLYIATEGGRAACLDAETGEVLWSHPLDGRIFASVFAAGEYVYFTTEEGVTTVVAQGREFRLVATNTIGEDVYASIAPIGNRLLVRGTDTLYAIGTH